MRRLFAALRLLRILRVALRHGLDELILSNLRHPAMGVVLRALRMGRKLEAPRGVRLRLALEELGPIFVKFGQLLSTRRDLLPPDLADELALLQDRVPPFDSALAARVIERNLGKPPEELFESFDRDPVASASIAQVHFARLPGGREVAVKVLRPGMSAVIDKDIALLRQAARLVEAISADGRRLRPREVVSEFDKYLHDELDLLREAANCNQLRRNFGPGTGREHLLIVPEVFWDYCSNEVFTMERMHGIPVGRMERLREAGIDIHRLAIEGVEIFFTQVFTDGFFHADMHPGNIYVSDAPESLGRYIALDFGIVGSLSEFDKNYLAQNFLAFFQRDYRRVARLHIESGWVPADTREEELEGAIRAVCEPYFDKPLAEISLGQVLLRLFQTSRRFNVQIQPQLVLLQKTLLNVEGLGRQLDPNLDLWTTAKPHLERWMQERIGPQGVWAHLKRESLLWAQTLPQIPRLLHEQLSRPNTQADLVQEMRALRAQMQGQSRRQWLVSTVLLVVVLVLLLGLVGVLPIDGL